jgi:hypothetical protein
MNGKRRGAGKQASDRWRNMRVTEGGQTLGRAQAAERRAAAQSSAGPPHRGRGGGLKPWFWIVTNRDGQCARCEAPLPEGTRAAYGGRAKELRCETCVAETDLRVRGE